MKNQSPTSSPAFDNILLTGLKILAVQGVEDCCRVLIIFRLPGAGLVELHEIASLPAFLWSLGGATIFSRDPTACFAEVELQLHDENVQLPSATMLQQAVAVGSSPDHDREKSLL
jgi:hypothetical protein